MEKRPLIVTAALVLLLLAANCSCGVLSNGGAENIAEYSVNTK